MGICDRVDFSGSCLQSTNASFMVFSPIFPRFDITWFEVSLTWLKCLGPRCFWADLTRNHSSFYF